LKAGPCLVTQIKTEAKDGYNADNLVSARAKKAYSPQRGHLKGSGGQLKHIREFRVNDTSSIEVGRR